MSKQKAVIYARYSSDNQREESIDGQVRECRAYADRQNIEIVGVYADRGLSGTNDKRPEFQQMLKDSSKGLFSYVIVYKGDRLSRNRYDKASARVRLKKNGVKILSAMEHIPEGPEGIILESVLDGMAEYYSANLAQNTLRGMKENAFQCKYNGAPVPFGYKIVNKEYHVNEDERKGVEYIFKSFAAGASYKSILTWLLENGFKIRGKNFTYNNLRGILKNPIYKGTYKFSDIVIEDGVPAIVDKETWSIAKDRRERRKRTSNRHSTSEEDFLLTGKINCGECQSYLAGDSGSGRDKTYYYYSCLGKKRKETTCKLHSRPKEELENQVVKAMNSILMSDDVIAAIADGVMKAQEIWNDNSDDLKRISTQIQNKKKEVNNLVEAVAKGLHSEAITSRLLIAERELDQLESAKAEIELNQFDLTWDDIVFYLYSFRNKKVSNEAFRKALIDTFLNEVIVYDDKIILAMNYTLNSKKATFLMEDGLDAAYPVRISEEWLPNLHLIRSKLETKLFVLPYIVLAVIPENKN